MVNMGSRTKGILAIITLSLKNAHICPMGILAINTLSLKCAHICPIGLPNIYMHWEIRTYLFIVMRSTNNGKNEQQYI